MPVKRLKPTTPARRRAHRQDTSMLTKKEPEKSLTAPLKKTGGRNAQGKITVRHRGGGAKRLYRIIDFKQDRYNEEAEVKALEYDPNRNAHIALVQYPDGEKRYIIAPVGLKVGDKIISSQKKVDIKIGNRMPLKHIPVGQFVYNVELIPGKGAEIVRAAGATAQVMAKEGQYAQLKLPSGEIRLIPIKASASIGQVSNPEYRTIKWGKAGRLRLKGRRPQVRGKAMNPRDHPHGGGEGGSPVGLKHPKTPWGKPALGVKTRKKGKPSDKLIIKRRK